MTTYTTIIAKLTNVVIAPTTILATHTTITISHTMLQRNMLILEHIDCCNIHGYYQNIRRTIATTYTTIKITSYIVTTLNETITT